MTIVREKYRTEPEMTAPQTRHQVTSSIYLRHSQLPFFLKIDKHPGL